MSDPPKLRTLPAAILELTKNDPASAYKLKALRRSVNRNEIPVIRVNSKVLVDMNVLISFLQTPSLMPVQESKEGQIRRIRE